MKNKQKRNDIMGYVITLVGLMITLYSFVFSLDSVLWKEVSEESLLIIFLSLCIVTIVASVFTFLTVLSRVNPKQYLMISYSGADEKIAMGIKRCLDYQFRKLSKYRFEVLTHDTIPFGSDFTEATQSHIEKAKIVLTIVTKDYVASERCRCEFMDLVNAEKQIIPIVVNSYSFLSRLPIDYSNVKALMIRSDSLLEPGYGDEELIKLAKELIRKRRD